MEIYDLKIAFCLAALSMPLAAAVPDGYVVKADSVTVYLDWGKSSGVQVGDQFKIYRSGEALKHPVTGEILGHSEEDLGQGVIENIEEKFSTGKLMDSKVGLKPGDRARHIEAAPLKSPIPTALSPVTGAPEATSRAPKELYRTEPASKEAIGLAIGDIDGDGKKDLVVAFRDQIEAFRWNGTKLESMAIFKGHGYGNFLSIDVSDLDGAGHDKIFASLFVDGVKRSRTVVLEYSQSALREVAHFGGFVRAFEHSDGKRELLWQDLSMSRELRVRVPAPLTKVDKNYREGKPIKFVRTLNDDQLFGFTWGDWDGDGSEDLAVLQNGERLRIFFKDAKWSSDERYGGTKADFPWENEQMGSVFPRMVNWKPASGKTQLLVSHNIQITPIRLARLKIYKDAEILDLGWNGLEMALQWKLPISGELADYGIADVMQSGAPQLWTAVVGAGDKTVLIAYQIP